MKNDNKLFFYHKMSSSLSAQRYKAYIFCSKKKELHVKKEEEYIIKRCSRDGCHMQSCHLFLSAIFSTTAVEQLVV